MAVVAGFFAAAAGFVAEAAAGSPHHAMLAEANSAHSVSAIVLRVFMISILLERRRTRFLPAAVIYVWRRSKSDEAWWGLTGNRLAGLMHQRVELRPTRVGSCRRCEPQGAKRERGHRTATVQSPVNKQIDRDRPS